MDRTQRAILLAGALLAATGVALGAFGAHALRGLDPQRLGWWQTGVQYQLWHAIALVALAALPAERVKLPAMLLAAGDCFGRTGPHCSPGRYTRWR